MMDPKRVARRDLGSITAQRAAEVLADVHPTLEAEVRRARAALRYARGLDVEDLHALSQVAALEASLSHDPTRGRTLRSWVSQVVRWRLLEAIQAAQHFEALSLDDFSPAELVAFLEQEAEEPAVDPTEDHDRAERVAWLQAQLAALSPRRRALIVAKLRGETQRDASRAMGISDARTAVEVQGAVAVLHRSAVDAGLVDR